MKGINKEQPLPVFLKSPMSVTYFGAGEWYLHSYFKKIHYTELFKPVEFFHGNQKNLYLHFAMRHPHLWKHFYFNMVKDHHNLHKWNTLMEQAYSFSDWYQTTPRSDRAYLSPITLDQEIPVIASINLVDTLQLSHIIGFFDKKRQKESKNIRKYVEEFVHDITKKLASLNKQFAATPILSGSVTEGTKVGLPDEYDFILHLHGLQAEFNLSQKESEQPFAPYFSADMPVPYLFKGYRDAFNEQVKKYEHGKNFFLHKSAGTGTDLGPFKITLSYTGTIFKDLKVDIDVVLAFKITEQTGHAAELYLSPASAKSPMFAVVKDSMVGDENLRVSFSFYEKDLIKSVPVHIKFGYCLAKAVRHTELCPRLKIYGKALASVYEYVTTYMLKTCLFHALKEHQQSHSEENEWLSPLSIKWAIRIYEKMKFFLEIFEGKIPSYFQWGADIGSRYHIIFQHGVHQEECRRKRQKITLIFINYILQLLNKLLQQRLQVRCLIQ